MVLFMGVIGGVVAGVPLRLLVESFGWRTVMGVSAGITAVLCAAIWLWVRDDPTQRGYASHAHGGGHTEHMPILQGLAQVLSYRNLLLLLLTQVPTGFASGNLIIGFAWAKESVPLRLLGMAAGVCNMGPLLDGMLLQPGMGWVLDRYWSGARNSWLIQRSAMPHQ